MEVMEISCESPTEQSETPEENLIDAAKVDVGVD
jgi:hypothetical protein